MGGGEAAQSCHGLDAAPDGCGALGVLGPHATCAGTAARWCPAGQHIQ